MALDGRISQNFQRLLLNRNILGALQAFNKARILFQPAFQRRKCLCLRLITERIYHLKDDYHSFPSGSLIASLRTRYRTALQAVQHHTLVHTVSEALYNIVLQILLNLF